MSEPVGVALLWLSAALTVLAAVMAATGGFTLAIAGVALRLHAVTRPVVASLVLGFSGLALLGVDGARGRFDRSAPMLQRFGFVAAVVFAGAVGAGVYAGGAHIAGGADSSGYLNEARLWRAARFIDVSRLQVATPLASELQLVNGQHAFTPVGFQPASTPGMVVPGYPPGLPLHFALVAAIAGERLQFIVVPLCAMGIAIVAFLIGRALGGGEAALVSAAAAGASPIMIYQATQPMSDVVAAFWWTLAVWLLLTPRWRRALAGGVAAAIACAVRPNLFALVPVLVLLALWWLRPSRRSLVALAGFCLPIAAAALSLAWLQGTIYGSASTTGYGTLPDLFGWQYVWPNLQRYPVWAFHTQSALVIVALAGPLAIRYQWIEPSLDRVAAERVAWSGLVLFASLQAFYLLYLSFEDWVYFRFLLPALPLVLVLQAITLTALCRRAPAPLRGVAIAMVAVLVASWGVGRARSLGAFRLQHSEQRYLDVAYFARGLPSGAVFLSLQHSGSLPYNAGATVLRWDWIDPSELDRAIAELSRKGRVAYAVLDDWEEAQFRERFAATQTVSRLRLLFSAGGPPAITARVYAVSAPTATADAAPVNWRPPLALRSPRRPATRDRESAFAN